MKEVKVKDLEKIKLPCFVQLPIEKNRIRTLRKVIRFEGGCLILYDRLRALFLDADSVVSVIESESDMFPPYSMVSGVPVSDANELPF